MGGVDGDGVDAAADERLDPRLEVVADPDGGGAAQAARHRRGWRWGTPGASGCPSP